MQVITDAKELEFLSTPSARRATSTFGHWEMDSVISIHALREEGDCSSLSASSTQPNFYPRPPRGGRPKAASQIAKLMQFLSTPSARRATFAVRRHLRPLRFLSTPSARRATYRIKIKLLGTTISIHALREEGDIQINRDEIAGVISIHALREEGDQLRNGLYHHLYHFYPRPPRGGRPLPFLFVCRYVYFYPRPPRGGRPGRTPEHHDASDFYPRPPRGGRLRRFRPPWCRCSISIHALREEGDRRKQGTKPTRLISIHALREEGDASTVYVSL